MTDSVKAGGNIVEAAGDGFMDLPRTQALWKEFRAPEALIKKADWVDRPSVGIPFLFVHSATSSRCRACQGRPQRGRCDVAAGVCGAKAAHLDTQVPLPDTLNARRSPIRRCGSRSGDEVRSARERRKGPD